MAGYYENDVNCSIYRSSDSINNFRIRVKLERLTSNALLPSLERMKIEDDLSRILQINKKPQDKAKPSKTDVAQALDETKRTDYEEAVVGWQKKLFNRLEYEQYGKGVGPESTALERKYFDDIQKMKLSGKHPGRIFTYIEGDPYCFAKDLDYFVTDSPNEEPTELALGVNNIRKRRGAQPRFKISDEEYLPKSNIVNRKPTPDDLRTNHYASIPHQTMYIMADLSSRADSAVAQLSLVPQPIIERVLCTIHFYSNGTIVMEPDFNDGKVAYLCETGGVSNEVFHYYLIHNSIQINKDDLVKERKLLNEFRLRKQTHLAQLVGNDFEMPLPAVLRLNIYGEIVTGKNFEYDDLYVYYCLDLPENWRTEPSMMLSGYTPTSSSTESSKHDDIVYFSHPFEFELWYMPSIDSADRELPPMPKIYFQVASQDGWSRHRTEGYTYLDIPSLPGLYDEELTCWRPRGDSIFNELRRFFIGGSNELQDISYLAIPKQFQNDKNKLPLSRFGFRTVSTGTLSVRFNVVFQSQEIAMEYGKGRGGRRTKSHYGFDTFMSNINATLNAYEDAKRRAMEVRESTLQILTPKEPVYD